MIISRRQFEEMIAGRLAQERLSNDIWDLQVKLKALEEEIVSLRNRIVILETTEKELEHWKDCRLTTESSPTDNIAVLTNHN